MNEGEVRATSSIEVIVCRDELDTVVTVLVDGVEVPGVTVRTIDPGRGWTRAEWVAAHRSAVEGVSVRAAQVVTEHYIRVGGHDGIEDTASSR